MSGSASLAILGVFVADTAYRADRQPRNGETVLGRSFALGPGGKGSNQAVAAARLGARVNFISRLGVDTFAELAMETWRDAGVTPAIIRDPDSYTGAAYIFVEDATGENAIIVCPGAASRITPADIDANAARIQEASVFITQLEQPIGAAQHALSLARASRVATILNPAPAAELPQSIFELCDFVTPNETEAGALTGMTVENVEQAGNAGNRLLDMGVGTAVVTLGHKGALICSDDGNVHVPAFDAGPVVETTGAGDAFNGGFAVALGEGMSVEDAVRFGCATAAISVTRTGTAPSMPSRGEVEALLAG